MNNIKIEKQTVKDYEGGSGAALLAGIVAVCIAFFNVSHYQIYAIAVMMFIMSYIIHLKNKEYKKYLEMKKVPLKDSNKWGDV